MPPTTTNRISVSTAGLIQQRLLEYQATLTGRSISSLASSLLEEIIEQKVQAGQWHPTAIRLVEELIKEREGFLRFTHAAALKSTRDEADREQEEASEDFMEMFHPDEPKEFPVPAGVFTDGEWAKAPAPPVDLREKELIAYGMRYGLTREEAEDVFEDHQDRKRSWIRYRMREEAGHQERLPEGESIESKDGDKAFDF